MPKNSDGSSSPGVSPAIRWLPDLEFPTEAAAWYSLVFAMLIVRRS